MKRLIAGVALAALFASPAAAATPDAEQAAIVAQVEAFFAAMKAKDPAAAKALMLEDVTFTAQRTRPDGVKLGRVPGKTFAEGLTGPDVLDERMWNPVVTRRGAIAVVWAPYEFLLNGKRTHCGIDVFDMVKVEGSWKIAHLMWTQEPDACAELEPKR
ncbi:MAG: hypothetical protein AB1942_04580 [Pseudomonadota bacterium]